MAECIRGLLLLVLSLFTCALQAQGVRLVDDRGVAVNLATPPQRIVSMLPSLTEVVCELGACDRLVGVDTFSNWPPAVRALAHVGGLDDANIEQIVALKPDLVLLAVSARAANRLEALGVKVIALEPRTLADLRRVLEAISKVLGTADAARAWARIDADVAAAARALPPSLKGTSVYFEVNGAPYAASESSFIGELMARVGVRNVVPGALGPFPKLNPEFIVRADPQVIMVAQRDEAALRQRPGWARMQAVRAGRICAFTPAQGDVLVRAGPRMAQATQLIVQCLAGRLKGGS